MNEMERGTVYWNGHDSMWRGKHSFFFRRKMKIGFLNLMTMRLVAFFLLFDMQFVTHGSVHFFSFHCSFISTCFVRCSHNACNIYTRAFRKAVARLPLLMRPSTYAFESIKWNEEDIDGDDDDINLNEWDDCKWHDLNLVARRKCPACQKTTFSFDWLHLIQLTLNQ